MRRTPPGRKPDAGFIPPRTACNVSPAGSTPITTRTVIIYLLQAGLITTLVLCAGMPPIEAAGLTVGVLATTSYLAAESDQRRTLAGHVVRMAGRWTR